MDIILVILAAVAAIPTLFLIIPRLRKRYKLDLDYKNIIIAFFSGVKNPKQYNQYCLVIYAMHIVNRSESSNTIKSVILSYKYNNKIYKTESYVVQSGFIPKKEKPAIILSNGIQNIILMEWYNIREKLGDCETLQPGGVFSGSSIFLFDSHVKDIRQVKDISLTVSNYLGRKSSHPIIVKEEWYDSLDKGFSVINRAFTISEGETIKWE